MCGVTSDTQKKKEPSIVSNGCTIEEIFIWMQEKLDARNLAATLEKEVGSLDSALILNRERLSIAKSNSFIDIKQK